MGYVRHHAIIATAWQAEAARGLVDYAESIGAQALIGAEVTNGYVTVCIAPDGSKEGWGGSSDGDERREKIKAWLKEQRDWDYEWCELAYGSDDARAEICDSEWNEPPTEI